jgi:hypothetical protein
MSFRSHVVHLGSFLSPKMSLKSGCQKRDVVGNEMTHKLY